MGNQKEISIAPEDLVGNRSGRTLYRDHMLYLLHAASFLEFELEGDFLEGEFYSDGGAGDYQAWIGIYVDDNSECYMKFPLKKGKERYLLWQAAARKKVKIRIVRLTENQYAESGLAGLYSNQDAQVYPITAKPLRIEFIGDSITCGFGIEGDRYDAFSTETENPVKAYAVLAAEMLHCEFTLTAWSGSGIISGWIPENEDTPNTRLLVPRLYRNTDYHVIRQNNCQPAVQYIPTGMAADIIIINLGTNDASYTREDCHRKKQFQEAYADFVRMLRTTYKTQPIICTANAMTDSLNGEIHAAVMQLRQKDNSVFYLQFSDQKEEDGYGAVEHPSGRRHKIMADELSEWIQNNQITKV